MIDGSTAGENGVEVIPRKEVLRRFGIRRDILADVFARTGWTLEPYDPSEVLVRFRGVSKGVPPLRALWVNASNEEYVLRDRYGRHWAASKAQWEIVPT